MQVNSQLRAKFRRLYLLKWQDSDDYFFRALGRQRRSLLTAAITYSTRYQKNVDSKLWSGVILETGQLTTTPADRQPIPTGSIGSCTPTIIAYFHLSHLHSAQVKKQTNRFYQQ